MKTVIAKLLQTANNLDSLGHFEEANRLTKLAYDFNNPEKEEIVDDSFINADEHESLSQVLEEMTNSGELNDEQVRHILDIVKEGEISDHTWEKESLVDDSLAKDMPVKEFSNTKKNYSIKVL
jgi:hypothetical protein